MEAHSLLAPTSRHWLTTVRRWLFSRAAATLSLSASCLLTAASEAWLPGLMLTLTFHLSGRDLSSFTLIAKPRQTGNEQDEVFKAPTVLTLILLL